MIKKDSWKGRLYTAPNGAELWSVTTKLGILNKPQLVAWAARVEREMVIDAAASLYEEAPPNLSIPSFKLLLQQKLGSTRAHQKEMEKAANIGTVVHDAIERELLSRMGRTVEIPTEAMPPEAALAFAKWQEWEKARGFEPRYLEQQVFSYEHGYAGTLDMVANYTRPDGSKALALVDWKTSSGIYLEYLLQIAAYHCAIREMGHFKDEELDGLIVKIPKARGDEEVKIVEIPHKDIMEKYIPGFLKVNAMFDAVKILEKDLNELVPYKPKKKEKK